MTKENYQAVLDQIALIAPQLDSLQSKVLTTANPEASDVVAKVESAAYSLVAVSVWAHQNIEKLNQEVVINSFSEEMKLLFEKYQATLESVYHVDGYGVDWGNANSGGVIRLTAILDGITSTRIIDKLTIRSEDF